MAGAPRGCLIFQTSRCSKCTATNIRSGGLWGALCDPDQFYCDDFVYNGTWANTNLNDFTSFDSRNNANVPVRRLDKRAVAVQHLHLLSLRSSAAGKAVRRRPAFEQASSRGHALQRLATAQTRWLTVVAAPGLRGKRTRVIRASMVAARWPAGAGCPSPRATRSSTESILARGQQW